MIWYHLLSRPLGLDTFGAAGAALSCFAGSYIAEIVRAGIQSIDRSVEVELHGRPVGRDRMCDLGSGIDVLARQVCQQLDAGAPCLRRPIRFQPVNDRG